MQAAADTPAIEIVSKERALNGAVVEGFEQAGPSEAVDKDSPPVHNAEPVQSKAHREGESGSLHGNCV